MWAARDGRGGKAELPRLDAAVCARAQLAALARCRRGVARRHLWLLADGRARRLVGGARILPCIPVVPSGCYMGMGNGVMWDPVPTALRGGIIR